MLGNVSLVQILIILVIVVLVFGTGKLKNAGRDLGGFFKGFKDGLKDGEKPADTPAAPPAQLTQQNPNATTDNVEKKDKV